MNKLPNFFPNWREIEIYNPGKLNEINGWGTWIRTRTDGVRVRCSAVKLFPSRCALNRLKSDRYEFPGVIWRN